MERHVGGDSGRWAEAQGVAPPLAGTMAWGPGTQSQVSQLLCDHGDGRLNSLSSNNIQGFLNA